MLHARCLDELIWGNILLVGPQYVDAYSVPLNTTNDFSVDAEIWYSPFILLKSHSIQGNLQSDICPVPFMPL